MLYSLYHLLFLLDYYSNKLLLLTEKIVTYLNNLISFGVAGFRIDAAKHMWPVDLRTIFSALNNLPTAKGFAPNTKPFIFQEVDGSRGNANENFNYNAL